MSTYRINFTAEASLWVEVEADDFDEAVEKAYDEMPATNFANDPFDLAQWEAEMHYEVDGEYIEQE